MITYKKLQFIFVFILFLPYAGTANHQFTVSGSISGTESNHREKKTIYVINHEIDLKKGIFSIPHNTELRFTRRGLIKNGTIYGDNTTLKGRVKLHCKMTGSFTNKVIPVSWLNYSDGEELTNQIVSIFNLSTPSIIKVDKDISLDGSRRDVEYISFYGNKRIKNCCCFRVRGDVLLRDVTFCSIEKYHELFLDFGDILRPISINIENVTFDGCWNVSRFLYCPYQKFITQSQISVANSHFTRIYNYVFQFRPACTGVIYGNLIENIGTDELSSVVGFHLGDSDEEEERMNAISFEISENIFRDFRIPYCIIDDRREAHALLLYGHNNIIKGNKVENFYSQKTYSSETGKDCEGIYLKGGGNVIIDNYLEDCIGGAPDGAITIKTFYGNNLIKGNTIKHKYGIGIQCYTPNSTIENNKIYSEQKAEVGLAMLGNSGSNIDNNVFFSSGAKDYHAAIALQKCSGIDMRYNQFENTSSVLTTYGCKNEISFENNTIELTNMIYGTNTYYTAPFAIHDDTAVFVFSHNTIKARGVRSSQLIEAPDGFKGEVRFNDNTLFMSDTKEVESVLSFLVRNVKTLTINQNKELSKEKRIRSVSNLNNNMTLDNK